MEVVKRSFVFLVALVAIVVGLIIVLVGIRIHNTDLLYQGFAAEITGVILLSINYPKQ